MSIMPPRVRRFPAALLITMVACLAGFASPANAAFSLDTLSAKPTNTAAGAYSDFVKTLEFGNDDTVKTLQIDFPKGQLGAVEQATVCPTATWNADPGTCASSSVVGYVDTDVTALGFLPQKAGGNIYRLPTTGTEVMRIGMYVTTGLASPMKIIGVARLRDDYALRVTVDNIPDQAQLLGLLPGGIRIDKMVVRMYGRVNNGPASANGFFFNPAECVPAPTTVVATAYNGQRSTKTSTYTPTDCAGVPFSPRVEFLPNPAPASAPAKFTVRVSPQTAPYAPNAARQAAPFRATSLVMPEGIQLTGATNSDGNLVACSDAQFGYGTSAPASCAAGADVGDVVMASPLVGDVVGDVYAAQPETGPGHENEIIRLFMLAQRGTQPDALRIKLRAKVDMNPVTKRLDVSLVDLPAQPIKSFTFTFRDGGAPGTRSPRLCGSYPGTASLTGYQSPTAVNVSSDYVVAGNCPTPGTFRPTIGVTTTPQTAGAASALTTNIDLPVGDEPMDKVTVSLPKGLLANIKDVPMCTRAEVGAASCPEASLIGAVNAYAGQVATPGQFSGKVYLSEPAPSATGAIAGLFMKVPVVVGPIYVDDIHVDAAVKLRSDFGLDVVSPIPSEVRKMEADIQRLQIVFNKPDFMVNPPVCTGNTVGGDFTSTLGTKRTVSSAVTFTGCDTQPFDPSISFSAGTPSAGGPSAFTARITQPATGAQAPPSAITMRLPDGVSLSPSAGSSGIAGCSDAQFDKATFSDPACPAASDVGTVEIQTPSIGQMSGKAYLGTAVPGHTARIFVDAESDTYGERARVKLEGLIDVDETTGQVTTTFTDIPPARFTDFQLTLRGGTNPVLSMPRTCGTYGGSATLTPHGGGSAADRSADLSIDAGCDDADRFDPNFTNVVSPTTAGAATTMATTIKVPQRHRALDRMELRLPAGLLGQVDGLPRCTIAQANAGSCAPDTEIGDVLALAGQGTAPGSFPGKLYLTDAPNAQSVVGIAVEIPAVVGPIDLGNVITIAEVRLRPADYGLDVVADVPTRVKGIPLHLQQLSLEIDRPGFLQNPSICGASSTTAGLRPAGGSAVTRSVPYQATGCEQLGFEPALGFSATPARAGGSAEFATTITAPASGQTPLRTAVVDLPAGVALSSSINAAGDLTGCTAAQFAAGDFSDPACAATSAIGTTEIDVPQVGRLSGKVYLAQVAPAGAIAGLYIDAKSDQFGQAVRVKLAGKVVVDEATGKTTASFDGVPAIPFSRFALKLRGGDNPAISMPRTCGTTEGGATLQPHGGAAAAPTASLTIDAGCEQAAKFEATGSVAVTPATAGSFTKLRTTIDLPSGQRELRALDIELPAGLLANVDGRERCTVAQAESGDCTAATKIGTVAAKAGQGAVGGAYSGDVFLVDAPSDEEILALGVSLRVQVGPIDLGKVNVVAPVRLRDDYGLDVHAALPTTVKGIPIYLRQLAIEIDEDAFLFTPSTCGDKTAKVGMTSAQYGPGNERSTAGSTSTMTITGCDAVAFEPAIAFSADPARAGGSGALTTVVSLPAGAPQSALKDASVVMPAGVSLSPSIDQPGTLTGCTDAQFERGAPSTAPACPPDSKVGTAKIQTPSVGELRGDVYLAASAAAGQIARVYVHAASSQFPTAGVKLVGDVDVDEATGRVAAVFADAPEVPFSRLELTFRGGDAPVLSLPRTCGTTQGTAAFTAHAGGSAVNATGSLVIDQNCAAPGFDPTVTTTVSPSNASAPTALTTRIAVPAGSQELDHVQLKLPAGLLANIENQPRCAVAAAQAGDCAAATRIGSLSAKAGQGATGATYGGGSVYLTEAPTPSALVGLAIELPVQVGKVGAAPIIDLGEVTQVGAIDLRRDYGIDIDMTVPTRHKGIPLYLREITLTIDKPGFMTNPATCSGNTTTGTLRSAQSASKAVSTAMAVTGCANVSVTPTVGFAATPNSSQPQPAGSAPSLTTTLGVSGLEPAPLSAATVELPAGVSLTGSANAAGDLTGCTDAQFDKASWADPACPAGSRIGSVTIDTPSVGEVSGHAYLAATAPAGKIARLLVDAESVSFGEKARIKIEGLVAVAADGTTTASFAELPAVAFHSFALTLRGGDKPVVSMPRSCGAAPGRATVQAAAGGTAKSATGALSLASCPPAGQFAPQVELDLQPNAAAANGKLTTTITVPGGDQELERLRIDMPEGLTAKLQGVPRCTIDQAQADACPADTALGTVSAKVGVPGAPFTQNGEAYLTAGRNGHVAGMALILDAKVGPIDLGKVVTIADIDLRSPDLAMRVTADVPTAVKGVRLDVRELKIAITRDAFLVNPSACGTVAGDAAFTGKQGASQSRTPTVDVDCAGAPPAFEPELEFSGSNPKTGEASTFTTKVTAGGSGAKSPFAAIAITLPEGMSLSASAGARGDLAGCTDAQFKQDTLNEASSCPAGSEVGAVKFQTSLVGDLAGKAYLAPATNGNLARLFLEATADPAVVENLTIRLVGEVRVDAASGVTRVVFEEVPAIPVDSFEVAMRGGDAPVLAMPRSCGAAQGSGHFTPVNGVAKDDGAALQVTDCPDPVPFEPGVQLDRSTTKAGETMDFTTTVTVPAKSQELSALDMTLPAGLLGKISSVPACALAIARQGDCDPASQVGTVTAKAGVHTAPFTVAGKVYLVKGDANSIARLAIVLPAKVGPVDLGNVITIAELKLRADYGLTITAPEIPTRVKGVRLDLSEFQLSIDRDDFMVNPVSCGDAPASATVRSAQNGAKTRGLTLATTDCADLKLDGSVDWGAAPASPLSAAAVTTTIGATAGGDALDAMKQVRVTLPEGVSLSPSAGARGDLAECAPGQFGAGDIDNDAACPAGSKIGTVVIDSPMVGELTGDAYLGVKAGGHFAGLYLQAKAAEYPALRVKLAGFVDVDETTGRMTAGFDDLPQVQVSRIALTLRGGDAPVISLPRTCGSFGGNVSIQRFGGGTSNAAGQLTLNADCPDPGAFGPQLGLAVGNPQAGASTSLTTAVAVPARQQELSSLQIRMPNGLLGKLTAVPLCDVAQAQAGACGPESAIGSVSAKVGTAGAPFTVVGTAYMTQGYDGAIAGLMFKLPAKVGPIDLGDVITMAKVELVGNDLQMVISAPSIPTRVKGIPLNLSELVIAIDRPGVIVNAGTCGAAGASASFGSAQGGGATGSAGYQAQGCGSLAWNPGMSLDFSGSAADVKKGGRPTITTVIAMAEGQGNLRKADVVLPAGASTDLTNVNARVCASAADAVAGNCPAGAVLGPVSVVTPALPAPVNGQLYLIRIPGAVLPGIAVRIRDQISLDLVGTTQVNSAGRVQVVFDGIPDTPITQMRLVFEGGRNGVIRLGDEICGPRGKKTDAVLMAQHGAAKNFALPVSCNGSSAPPQNLNSAETTKTSITMRPSGSGSAMTFALSNPNGIRRIMVTMPRGAIFTKKAKKYVKPKLTGDKAKTKVTNGDRRLRITITPAKKGGKVTKVKFSLPKRAIKINIKVRKILNNKKLSKKKRDAQLKKVMTPKVELLDGLGKTVKVPVKLKVKASTKIVKKKKSLGPVHGSVQQLPGTPGVDRLIPGEVPAGKPEHPDNDRSQPTTPVD